MSIIKKIILSIVSVSTFLLIFYIVALNPDITVSKDGDYIDFSSYKPVGVIRGNVDALNQLVIFTDYQCTVCATFHKLIDESLLIANKIEEESLNIQYIEVPLNSNSIVAQAALAADEQNLYHDFQKSLYESKLDFNTVTSNELSSIASTVGLDVDLWSTRMNNELYKSQVKENIELYKELNLLGTPSIIYNGILLTGSPDNVEKLNEFIEEHYQEY